VTTHCGVWFAKGRLVAVVVDDEGRAAPALFVATNDDARWGLLKHLDGVHGLDCDLVIAEDLAKADPLCRLALKRGAGVWVAPQRLVDAVRAAASLSTGPPARIAAMLARLALVPGFREHLRRMNDPPADMRQLPLL
jgi:hypothetical protein